MTNTLFKPEGFENDSWMENTLKSVGRIPLVFFLGRGMWVHVGYKNETFPKRWRYESHAIYLTEFSSMTGCNCVLKFLRLNVDGKHLMHFLSETSIFEFSRHCVGWAYPSSEGGTLPIPWVEAAFLSFGGLQEPFSESSRVPFQVGVSKVLKIIQ